MDEFKWVIPCVGHPSAGKSSLIRILTGKKVPVGKKSGTTKKIHTIPLSRNVAILDFPGFGKVTGRSKKFADKLQQLVVDQLEAIESKIIVGILVSDLSNVELVAEKLNEKGNISIDYELAEFLQELSQKPPIVLGNKIDKVKNRTDFDYFATFFPENIYFFPVSLKYKKELEPFLYFLQTTCDEEVGEELAEYFWKP